MGLRQRFLAGAARQLGHPSGLRGRLVARGLNRGNRTLVEAAVRASGVRAGQAAADVGFGGGVGLRMLLDAVGPTGRVHGVDLSTTMVDRARSTFASDLASGRLDLQVGSMLGLPLADASLDGVISVNTIYFLEDLAPALRELVRVLRPGGRLVVGIGDPDAMARAPVTAYGFHLRPVPDLLEELTAAGLRGVRSERLTAGPMPRHLLLGEI